jgi:hypothetical protein
MAEDMRTCKYCGRETSKAANFCWYCARELEARPERPDAAPTQSRLNRWMPIAAAVLVGIGIFLIFIAPLLR